MPGEIHHRIMTRQALASCGINDAQLLVDDYCTWPDNFHPRYDEIQPYMFIMDGVEFHYLPHTPVEDFYRYWRYLPEKGVTRQLPVTPNGNQQTAMAGFEFYLKNTLAALRNNAREEAWKFLGCLLHTLEDQSFGIHALEGPDGTDIFVLDRLAGDDIAKKLCALPLSEELYDLTVKPDVFAADAGEFASLLYRRYAETSRSSRRALFNIALEYINDSNDNAVIKANEKIMFLNAVQLAADTIATLFALAGMEQEVPLKRELGDFEPFCYPIGGGGRFPLRKYEMTDGWISFGINHEARLLYVLPEGLYRTFQGEICGSGIGTVQVDIINAGKVYKSITLTGNENISLSVDAPGGVFGIIAYAISGRGELNFANGIFTR